MLHFYYQLLLLYCIISPRQADQIMLLFYMGTLTGDATMGLCQFPRGMGVPGIWLCQGSMSTPQEHGSTWHSALSRVNVNSSRTWECLAFDSVMGQCQLLQHTGVPGFHANSLKRSGDTLLSHRLVSVSSLLRGM